MREPSRADPRVEPIKIAGPPGARPLLLSYPWTPGNAAYIAALGGPAEAASRRNASELIRGLARTRRTVLFEYPPGVTGDNDPPPELPIGDVAGDVLAVADAVGADTFELLGYSWSASVAIEVAARSDRCEAVIAGGWPPLDAPIRALAASCRERADAVADRKTALLMRMYASYYESLAQVPTRPSAPAERRTVFYGDLDREAIAPGASSVADAVEATQDELKRLKWHVHRLPGHDHQTAMEASSVIAAVRAADAAATADR